MATRPGVRISGFDDREVPRSSRRCGAFDSRDVRRGRHDQGRDDSEHRRSVDAPHRLSVGETLTHWRNQEVAALVVIDWDPEGDEEGLAALNRLDDQSVLADDDPELAGTSGSNSSSSTPGRAAGRGEAPPWTPTRRSVSCSGCDRRSPQSLAASLDDLRRGGLRGLAHIELIDARRGRCRGRNLRRSRLVSGHRTLRGRSSRAHSARPQCPSKRAAPANRRSDQRRRPPRPDRDRRSSMRTFSPSRRRRRAPSRPHAAVVQGGGHPPRRQIDLSLWLELFERRADQAGLGQIVREHIAATVSGSTRRVRDPRRRGRPRPQRARGGRAAHSSRAT